MIPDRVLLTPTPFIEMRLSKPIAPPTKKKAAEEISAGTTTSQAIGFCAGDSVIDPASRTKLTPKVSNMVSVWSLVGIRSITLVGVSAYNPASKIQDLTCALATGIAYVIPFNPLFAPM